MKKTIIIHFIFIIIIIFILITINYNNYDVNRDKIVNSKDLLDLKKYIISNLIK